MRKFSIHLSEYVEPGTKIPVYDLYTDETCVFSNFYDQIKREGNLMGDLAGAINHLKSSANLLRLPVTKINIIEQKRLPAKCKLYEAKKNQIRIYFFHEEKTGRIIVTGGKKSTQKQDINAIVNLLREYYDGK